MGNSTFVWYKLLIINYLLPQNYLTKFGYISLSRSANNDATTGIKYFQKFFGLPVTGTLDENTIEVMNKPRCGFPDTEKSSDSVRVKRYDARYGKWSKNSLKYYLSYGEDLSRNDQAKIFAKAFKVWSDAAPKLRFTRTTNLRDANFKIRYCIVHFIYDFISQSKLTRFTLSYCETYKISR